MSTFEEQKEELQQQADPTAGPTVDTVSSPTLPYFESDETHFFSSNWWSCETTITFDSMDLREDLLKGIDSYGFQKLSLVQQKTIEPFITGKDIIAHAPPGTGKTASYVIGILHLLDTSVKECQAVIVVTTETTGLAIGGVFGRIGKLMSPPPKVCSLVGGKETRDGQLQRALQDGTHVLLGTPDIVCDMMSQDGILPVDKIKVIVLDQLDDLMSRGYDKQLHGILETTPETTQSVIFSDLESDKQPHLHPRPEPNPHKVQQIINKLMRRTPIRLKFLVKDEDKLHCEGIRHYVVALEEVHKAETLCDILPRFYTPNSNSGPKIIIYCQSRRKVVWLADKLKERRFDAICLYLEIDTVTLTLKQQREITLHQLSSAPSNVIITTDAYRTIDIYNCPETFVNVLNYDCPVMKEHYINRVGRTSRSGKTLMCINFVTQMDAKIIAHFEEFYDIKMEEMPNTKEHPYL